MGERRLGWIGGVPDFDGDDVSVRLERGERRRACVFRSPLFQLGVCPHHRALCVGINFLGLWYENS